LFELPRLPLLSVGELQHVQVKAARPFAIGNSWGGTANAIFDRCFFSGLPAAVTPAAGVPDLAAGQPFTLTITGLPYHSSAPRNIALGLAAVIIVLGAWAAARSTGSSGDRSAERKQLITRREKLFQDLVRLEQDHRRGRFNDGRYSARREELLAALENIYGALDEDGTGPDPATRAGVAA